MALQLAVLLSGGGSNFRSICEHIDSGVLDAEIKVVISNKEDAGGLAIAKEYGYKNYYVDPKKYSSKKEYDAALVSIIHDTGLTKDNGAVILAGYMRLVSEDFLANFPWRVLNIHPSLLPSFVGLHGQKQAVDYGVKLAGCTVHFVIEEMDAGAIIIQGARALDADIDEKTAVGLILEMEHRMYPQAIEWLSKGRLEIKGRKVVLLNTEKNTSQIGTKNFLINPPLEEGFFKE